MLSIAQGVGGAYTDVYAHHIANGMTHEQAASAASRAAIISGVISAIVSKIPGARAGTGQITAQAMRAEMQSAMRAVLSAAAKNGVALSKGAVEGMAEELLEGALQHFNTGLHKGMPLEQLAREYLDQIPQNLATSGVMSGGQAGMGKIFPGQPLPDATTPGQTSRQPHPQNPSPGGAPGAPRLQFSRAQTNDARQKTQQNLVKSAIQSIIDHDNTTTQSQSQSSAGLHPDRSGGGTQKPQETTRALLGTSEGTIPGWAGAAGQRRRGEAEKASLERHATPPADKGVRFGEGGEHHVYHRPGKDFVTKATPSGKYGQVLDQMGPEEGYRFNLRPATPSEYLARIGLTNKVFGDDIRVIGYEQTPEGPSIVTTQGLMEGPHPEHGQVEEYLRAKGFEPMDERLYDSKTINSVKRPWYRARDGVVVVDAKPQNFVLHNGKVAPVDLMIQLLSDDVLNLTKSTRQRQYSRVENETGGPTLGSHFGNDAAKLNQQVAETTRLLNERQPGLINENTQVFHSADEFLNSDYARQHPFTEEEKAAMRSAEGFFDASTGKTVIIAGNVGLRGGETPQSALTRVVLHERVGHDGLKLLLDGADGKPNANRARWNEIQGLIPGDQLKAIGNERGYEHLRDNPEGQALEWFARKAESNPALLKTDPVLKQVWGRFTQIVQDFMARIGMDPLKGKDLDTQVMALLNRARQAAVKGGGGGSRAGSVSGSNPAAPASSGTASLPATASNSMPPSTSAHSGSGKQQPTTANNSQPPQASPQGRPSRPPLSVEGSHRLIANVMARPEHARQHPTVLADLAQAQRVVAQAAAQKPAAKPSRPPLSVEGSRRLIANVMARPEHARQHPTVLADLAQAQAVGAGARMA